MHTKDTEGRVTSISHNNPLYIALCSTLLLGSDVLQCAPTQVAHLCSRKAEQPWGDAPARWACPSGGQLAGLGGTALPTGAWGPPLQCWALCLAQHRVCCLPGLQAWCRGFSD